MLSSDLCNVSVNPRVLVFFPTYNEVGNVRSL
jgi:hypothetical protein